jgi:hypothetical protein
MICELFAAALRAEPMDLSICSSLLVMKCGSIAHRLACRAAVRPKNQLPFGESLYKGDLGIAVLISELRHPEFASMPFFELEV